MSTFDRGPEYGMNDYLADHVDLFAEKAKFYGSYASDPDRYNVLLSAGDYDEKLNLEWWKITAEHYPKSALVADKITKYDNEDIPVRAYYLSKALARLLQIADAPEEMIADLSLLLSSFVPKGAKKYADAQRALIENPRLSVTKISEISKLDRSTIHALLKKGVLVRPDQG